MAEMAYDAQEVIELLVAHLDTDLYTLYREHGLDYLSDEHGQVTFWIEKD